VELLDFLRNNIPTAENETPIEMEFNNFHIKELFAVGIYSLILIYEGNIIFSRATFRQSGCVAWKNKRETYLAALEVELNNLFP